MVGQIFVPAAKKLPAKSEKRSENFSEAAMQKGQKDEVRKPQRRRRRLPEERRRKNRIFRLPLLSGEWRSSDSRDFIKPQLLLRFYKGPLARDLSNLMFAPVLVTISFFHTVVAFCKWSFTIISLKFNLSFILLVGTQILSRITL